MCSRFFGRQTNKEPPNKTYKGYEVGFVLCAFCERMQSSSRILTGVDSWYPVLGTIDEHMGFGMNPFIRRLNTPPDINCASQHMRSLMGNIW